MTADGAVCGWVTEASRPSVGLRPLERNVLGCRLWSNSGGAEAVRVGVVGVGRPLPNAAAKDMGFFFTGTAASTEAADVGVVVLFLFKLDGFIFDSSKTSWARPWVGPAGAPEEADFWVEDTLRGAPDFHFP